MKEKIVVAVALLLTSVVITTSIYARDYKLELTEGSNNVIEATHLRVGSTVKPGDRLIWNRTGYAGDEMTITINYNDGLDPQRATGGYGDNSVTIEVTDRGIAKLDHWVVKSNNLSGSDTNDRKTDWNLSLKPAYKGEGGSGHHHGSSDDEEEPGSTGFVQDPDTLILIKYLAANADITAKTKIGKQEQGALAKQVFKGSLPAGWTELLTFNMTIDDKADQSLKNGQMIFCPPVRHLKAGRQFAVLGIDKSGKVKVFNDLDKDPGTITVQLDLEGYAFDLICKDR